MKNKKIKCKNCGCENFITRFEDKETGFFGYIICVNCEQIIFEFSHTYLHLSLAMS